MVKEKKDSLEVVAIATETEAKIYDPEAGENFSVMEAICNMWNEIREIKKAVV